MNADIALTAGAWVPMRGTLRWSEYVDPREVAELRAQFKAPVVRLTTAVDTTLIACPTCRARLAQACRTAGGNPTAPHRERLISRRCECGAVLEPRKQLCEVCRKRHRKETYRSREIRKRTAERRSAA